MAVGRGTQEKDWFSQDPPDSSGVIPSPLAVAGGLTVWQCCGQFGYHTHIWSHITCVGDAGSQT